MLSGCSGHVLHSILWETRELLVTPAALFFSANVKGWQTIYAIPFSGAHANRVLEDLCSHDWESSESPVGYATNVRNGWPNELVVHFNSHEQLKLKNVIEFTNAAKIHFLKRLLQTQPLRVIF